MADCDWPGFEPAATTLEWSSPPT